MIRGTVLATLTVISLHALGQSWCPLGAEWTFNYSDMMSGWHGITRVEYEGDSTVGGFTAQKLQETNVIAPWGSTEYTSFTYPTTLLTRYDDGVVFVWGGWPESFDTLMWFDASPGQFWLAPHLEDTALKLTVLDTSLVVFNGVPLRQLVLQFGGWGMTDTLRERIGYSFNYLNGWSWFLTDQPWNGMRCYRDAQIDFDASGALDCDFTLGPANAEIGFSAAPFPNPGTDRFTMSLAPGTHTITLFDATGRAVLQQSVSGDRAIFDTVRLPSGLYVVRVEDDVRPLRWVKE